MWIFTKHGFFSVTQHPQRRDMIQIRARVEQDLLDLRTAAPTLDRCPIHETPDADYRWRMVVNRWKWELVAKVLTDGIDYSNFKGKMATVPTQRNKSEMLHRIWDLHHAYQEAKHRKDPLAGHPELFRAPGGKLFSDADEREFFKERDARRFDEDHEAACDQAEQEAEWAAQAPTERTPGRRKPSKAKK